MRNKFLFGIFALIFVVASLGIVSAASVGFVTGQNFRPNFQTSYSQSDLGRYWPVLDELDDVSRIDPTESGELFEPRPKRVRL